MAGGPPQIPPQMMQMLQAGGAPGGAPGAQPQPPGAPPAAAAIGRMLQGQRQTPQGSGQMETKILEQCMVQIGKVLQTIMMSNPKAYQTLLKAQMSLHSTMQALKEGAQEDQEHGQLTSSIMQLLRSSPGGSTATGGAPGTGGPQVR
jgi:hypothetical protein